MGDVGSAVATPFVAVATTVTGDADRKIYYDCPRCGEEVWVRGAAAAFVGRKCIDCRGKSGPLDLGVVGDVVDVAVTPVTAVGAIVTGKADERIYYNCPKCGERRWVSAMTPHYEGQVCLECKSVGQRIMESVVPGSAQALSNPQIKANDNAKAQVPGPDTVVYQQYGVRSDVDKSGSFKLSDKIEWYETRSCRILHGSISWLANAVVQSNTKGQADLMDHWWLVIKTENGYYYQLQFRANLSSISKPWNPDALIELRKCSSSSECDETGLAEVGRPCDSDVFKQDSYSSSKCSYTIGDVVTWMKSHAFPASWQITHNCQDLCKAFHRKF